MENLRQRGIRCLWMSEVEEIEDVSQSKCPIRFVLTCVVNLLSFMGITAVYLKLIQKQSTLFSHTLQSIELSTTVRPSTGTTPKRRPLTDKVAAFEESDWSRVVGAAGSTFVRPNGFDVRPADLFLLLLACLFVRSMSQLSPWGACLCYAHRYAVMLSGSLPRAFGPRRQIIPTSLVTAVITPHVSVLRMTWYQQNIKTLYAHTYACRLMHPQFIFTVFSFFWFTCLRVFSSASSIRWSRTLSSNRVTQTVFSCCHDRLWSTRFALCAPPQRELALTDTAGAAQSPRR